jgi:DNA-binding NtrC family response regulator
MTQQQRKIMIVEDDPGLRDTLAQFLTRLGYQVSIAPGGSEALAHIDEELPDLILSDISMPGLDGMALLHEVKTRYPDTVIILMTGFISIDVAIEAVRQGAEDYLSKPLQLGDVQMRIERAFKWQSMRSQLTHLETQMRDRYRFDRIIGRSRAMQRVFEVIERVAPTNATVLISGRTGTGKELVAHAIHHNSVRAAKPFIDINCGALPDQLVESELFGYQRGAFTGATESRKGLVETASTGTLFLDEVQALKLELQAKLLRVLQERVVRQLGGRKNIDVDVRVIAATNQDINDAVRKGEFREDLYYRLNVVNIYLPELSERREDIPLLIDLFLKRHSETDNQDERHFSNEAMRLLLGYSWPGNVRELENAVEHALAIGSDQTMKIPDLPPYISGLVGRMGSSEPVGRARTLEEVERRHILSILEETGGNHVRAAETLGIDRRTLYRKLDKYKIPEAANAMANKAHS